MPRPRTISDAQLLDHALALMEQHGSDALTFAALAERSGLSGSTLVQRFGTKQRLLDAAIAHGWDALEQRTRQFADEEPHTPAGAITILSRLSQDYGDIESYADKLQLLREDLRNPVFRARGDAWVSYLASCLERCLVGSELPVTDPKRAPGELGRLLVAQWQGALVLWAFAPREPLPNFIRGHLERYLAARSAPARSAPPEAAKKRRTRP
ncbi:MAG: helix-turn-helix domain-containing protein [Polyangiales bacterium]